MIQTLPARQRPAGARRGRLFREAWLRALQAALRCIDSAWELSQSPLAKYRDLQALGRRRYARRALPEGWAVQAVLRLACARVTGALEPRQGEFLRRWVAGESIAGIAASAGMSRSHLSRRDVTVESPGMEFFGGMHAGTAEGRPLRVVPTAGLEPAQP